MKTNVLLWGLFITSSMTAAIHVGPNYTENLEVYKNTNFEEIQNLFGITQKLILDHPEEILNVKHDQVIKWTKAKVLVYSNSVLCLGKLSDHSEANQRWEGQVADFQLPASYEDYWESMESQLSSRRRFSQNLHHCRFFRRSRLVWKNGTLNL